MVHRFNVTDNGQTWSQIDNFTSVICIGMDVDEDWVYLNTRGGLIYRYNKTDGTSGGTINGDTLDPYDIPSTNDYYGEGIVKYGNYLYLGDEYGGPTRVEWNEVLVVNITDWSSPQLLYKYNLTRGPNFLGRRNSTIYEGSGNTVLNTYGIMYDTQGSLMSQIYDTTLSTPTYFSMDIINSTPQYTNISWDIRSADSFGGVSSQPWSTNLGGQTGRFVQWRISLNSTNENYTSIVDNVTISYGAATDQWGNYNYTIQAPSWGGIYEVLVNSTYGVIYGEARKNLTVVQVPDITAYWTWPLSPYYPADFTIFANVTDDNLYSVNFTLIDYLGNEVYNQNGTESGVEWSSITSSIDSYNQYNYTIYALDQLGYSDEVNGIIELLEVSGTLSSNTVNQYDNVSVWGHINLSNGTDAAVNTGSY